MKNLPRIVLCAEDDPDDKELFCNAVQTVDPSIQLIHSPNGKLLLEQLVKLTSEGLKPCLITLDINMPVMDGKQTLTELKNNQMWSTIPVAIYTTSPKHLYKDLELIYNAEVITKPSKPSEIIDIVTKLLTQCT